MRGWIFPYYDQGSEGAVLWAFQDAAFAASRDAGWNLDGLCDIRRGDKLTIFDEDGAVLWSGVIDPVTRISAWQRVTPGDGNWFPKGVTLETWRAWLWHRPPLAAELERN